MATRWSHTAGKRHHHHVTRHTSFTYMYSQLRTKPKPLSRDDAIGHPQICLRTAEIPVSDLTRDALLSEDSFAATLFDRRMVRGLIDDHANGRRNEEIRLWTLLSLEQWARTSLLGRPEIR